MRTPSDRGRFPVHGLLLFIMVLAALAIRIVFLNGRWINPDEGAHLMDGFLALEGFRPFVDYESRQVFYTYVLAAVLRLLGVSYEAARFYPVVATVGVGILVYLISRRLFDQRAALVAAAIYLFLPFTIVFGTQVKTEPLTILLSCLGVYTLLVGLERKGRIVPFLLTGVFLGLAFYTRQSALALLLAAMVTIVLLVRGWPSTLRAAGGVLGGFTVVCAAAMISFAVVMPASRVVVSGGLNPAAFVFKMAGPVVGISAGKDPAVQAPAAEASPADTPDAVEEVRERRGRADQPWRVTIRNVIGAANLNAFLLVGLFLSPVLLWWRRGRSSPGGERDGIRAAKVLYPWFGAVLAAYVFYTAIRGFFPAYFGELLPPLSILTAVVGFDTVARLRGARGPGLPDLGILASVALGFVLLHVALGPLAINRPLYYAAVPALLAPIYLSGRLRKDRNVPGLLSRALSGRLGGRYLTALAVLMAAGAGTVLIAGALGGMLKPLLYAAFLVLVFGVLFAAFRRDPVRDSGLAGAFVAYSVLLGTFVLWLGTTQAEIDRTFGGIWSPATVAEVATYLEERTEPGDEVLSGGVIWELQAGRRAFMLLSHPLGFRAGMPPDQQHAIERRLQDDPPPVIIMDGYTEQTYQRNVPIFDDVLADRYRLERTVEGSFYPVRIYGLIPSAAY